MSRLEDDLVTIPLFRRVATADLRLTAPLWTTLKLKAGQPVWDQGSAVDEMAVVLSGELSALVNGTEVGRVMPGEMIGEVAAFLSGSTRSASLRARKDSTLLTLPVPGLRALRWQRSPVYEALLDQALLALARRIRTSNLQVARIAEGASPAPVREEPSVLARLWRTLRPGGPKEPCPPLNPLLAQQPVLRTAEPALLDVLAAAFVAVPMEEGGVLCLEGETGDAAWLIAAGEVDVLRNVRGNRAELLKTLRAGDLFGVNALVELAPRSASGVARSAGWLYRIEAKAFQTLQGETRLIWRESVLASLALQLRNANGLLARLEGGVPNDDGFRNLLAASGYLESLPAHDRALAELQVVVDEDQLRNPRRR